MNNSSKVVIGLGFVSSALVAAWLVTGDRKRKTKDFLVKKATELKRSIQKNARTFDDSEVHYI